MKPETNYGAYRFGSDGSWDEPISSYDRLPTKPEKPTLTAEEQAELLKMSQRQAREVKALKKKRHSGKLSPQQYGDQYRALVDRHEAENKAFWDKVSATRKTR